MVHIKKCPLKIGRSKPSTEFTHNGKPQIYCYGWIDCYNDEPLAECKKCADWVYGEQCEKDFAEHLKKIKEKKNEQDNNSDRKNKN